MDKKIDKKIIPLGVTIGGYSFEGPTISSQFESVDGTIEFVIFLLNSLVGLSALVAVLMIVYAAYVFITAGGNADNIKKGSDTLTAAVVGMAIVFLARTIVVFVLQNFVS